MNVKEIVRSIIKVMPNKRCQREAQERCANTQRDWDLTMVKEHQEKDPTCTSAVLQQRADFAQSVCTTKRAQQIVSTHIRFRPRDLYGLDQGDIEKGNNTLKLATGIYKSVNHNIEGELVMETVKDYGDELTQLRVIVTYRDMSLSLEHDM